MFPNPSSVGGGGGAVRGGGGGVGFTGPTTHFSSWGAAATASLSTPGPTSSATAVNDAAALGADAATSASALLSQQQQQQLREESSIRVNHAASVVSATTVACGLVVATATVGALTIICAPFSAVPISSNSNKQQQQQHQQLPVNFNARSSVQQTVALPDAPTCITLFPLVAAPAPISSSGAEAASSSSSSSSSSHLAFELCCAVGTLSGNVHLFRVSSRSGTPSGLLVTQPGICVCERALRQQRDGSFAPGVHRSDAAIVAVASSYNPGLHVAMLAVATQFGISFVTVRKESMSMPSFSGAASNNSNSNSGSSDLQIQCVESIWKAPASLHGSVVSVREIEEQQQQQQQQMRSAGGSNAMTFSACYDDGSVAVIDFRFVAHPGQREPQVLSQVVVVVNPRPEAASAGGGACIVAGDVFVSAGSRDVTFYAIEEGGAAAYSFVPSLNSTAAAASSSSSVPLMSANGNATFGGIPEGATSVAGSKSYTSSMMGAATPTAALATNGARLGVPPLNSIRCVSATQAVASCRSSMLLLSAPSAAVARGRYNTRSLANYSVVVNDFVLISPSSSSSSGNHGCCAVAAAGNISSGIIHSTNNTLGATIAIVASDRILSMLVIPVVSE